MKRFFCTHCEAESGDHDLLHFVTGDLVCAMSVCKERDKCGHRDLNDTLELEIKQARLDNLLHVDFKRRNNVFRTSIKDMMPDGEVLMTRRR